MANPSDLVGEVTEAAQLAEVVAPPPSLADARKQRHAQRRTEAVAMRLAGLTYEQIGERLGITADGAYDMVRRSLKRAENNVVEVMREEESARLDRAQAAIWTKVLEGDTRAVDTFLRISQRRAKLFGLDEPTRIDLSVGIRHEMHAALDELQQVVLGEVTLRAEADQRVLRDDPDLYERYSPAADEPDTSEGTDRHTAQSG